MDILPVKTEICYLVFITRINIYSISISSSKFYIFFMFSYKRKAAKGIFTMLLYSLYKY